MEGSPLQLSLFHMKIAASVTKNSHQNHGPCYLHLPVFPYTYILICWKIKSCRGRCFSQQIRPLTTVQLCILQDYSNVRIVLNMNLKLHTLSIYVKFQ